MSHSRICVHLIHIVCLSWTMELPGWNHYAEQDRFMTFKLKESKNADLKMRVDPTRAAWCTKLQKNAQAQTYMFGMQTTSGNTCTCVTDTLQSSLGVMPPCGAAAAIRGECQGIRAQPFIMTHNIMTGQLLFGFRNAE